MAKSAPRKGWGNGNGQKPYRERIGSKWKPKYKVRKGEYVLQHRIRIPKYAGKTAKQEEMDAVVDLVVELYGKRARKFEIKAALRQWKPDVSIHEIEDIMRDARKRMLEQAGADFRHTKSDAVSFYESILRNPAARNQDKLKAQERLDWLFGNDAKFTMGTGAGRYNAAQLMRVVLRALPPEMHDKVMGAVTGYLGVEPKVEEKKEGAGS